MSTAVITVEELDAGLGASLHCEVTYNGKRCGNSATVRIRWTDCRCGRPRSAFICASCLSTTLVSKGYACARCGHADFRWAAL